MLRAGLGRKKKGRYNRSEPCKELETIGCSDAGGPYPKDRETYTRSGFLKMESSGNSQQSSAWKT